MKAFAWLLLLAFVAGCATQQPVSRPSHLTYGMVDEKIHKGVTTKNEILQVFGPPNITTKNAKGNDVWTYDKSSAQASASEGYWSLILAGQDKTRYSSSAMTVTLMVEFDQNDLVRDYDFYQTSY